LDGQEYTMVFSRRQNAEDPMNDYVGLLLTFLVYDPKTKSYRVTQDLRYSQFSKILTAAKAPEAGFGTYNYWYEKINGSSFPAHFYTVK
jgi:hypothetical protein